MANLIDKDVLLEKLDKLYYATDYDNARQGGILLCRKLIRELPEYINGVGRTAMISQPMRGRTDDEIEYERDNALSWLKAHGFDAVDTFFKSDKLGITPAENPLFYLSHAIDGMSKCDTVYFCRGWEDARGCRIEHAIAEAYGLQILYEDGDEVKVKSDG